MSDVNAKSWLKEFYTPTEKSGVDLLRMVKQARRIIEEQDKRIAELKTFAETAKKVIEHNKQECKEIGFNCSECSNFQGCSTSWMDEALAKLGGGA